MPHSPGHAPPAAGSPPARDGPAYCTSRERAAAPANWWEAAPAFATELLHGAAAALAPVGDGDGMVMGGEPAGYTVADFLLQHASNQRRYAQLPEPAWIALTTHPHDLADAARLGDSAQARLLPRHPEPLYQQAADAGDRWVARRLVGLGKVEEALSWLRTHADAGVRFVGERLVDLLADHGKVEELRAEVHAGRPGAAERFLDLVAASSREEAERLRRFGLSRHPLPDWAPLP